MGSLRMIVSAAAYRELLKLQAPAVYMLHMAAWRAGYTVNGIAPSTEGPRKPGCWSILDDE